MKEKKRKNLSKYLEIQSKSITVQFQVGVINFPDFININIKKKLRSSPRTFLRIYFQHTINSLDLRGINQKVRTSSKNKNK